MLKKLFLGIFSSFFLTAPVFALDGYVNGPLTVNGAIKGTLEKREVNLGSISATTTFILYAPHKNSKVTGIKVINSSAITADNTNYWTVTVVNKGQAGAGTTNVLATSDANTTKATGGSGLSAYVVRNFTLTSTLADLNLASNDVIVITFTKTASATTLTDVRAILEYKGR